MGRRDPSPAAALALAARAAVFADGDAARGAKLLLVCMACHSAQAGVNETGPGLAAI
ncbi:MAG: hypothetical protein M0015_18895 [Betaproteobacteria bacterium]|nr:hypothetical protein [Betaproteobacteria bacterium]